MIRMMAVPVSARRCCDRIYPSLLWLTFVHTGYSSYPHMLGFCQGCCYRVTFVLSRYRIYLLLILHMLLWNLTSWPCWDYGCRLDQLCCWFFGCCCRFCRSCRLHDLVLADPWWCQSMWIFRHSERWYSLACSLPWMLLLYCPLDVRTPYLTNKTSSAIDVVALLDELFVMTLLILW